jgi:c(7)-type cytochrome triheme protein
LAEVADGYCTSCHADQRTKNDSHKYHRWISAFGDHPFEKWAPGSGELIDPGQIKFNHAVHLAAEGVLGLVGQEQLDCSNCHQADDAGRHMKKISYQAHCQKCHPLSVAVTGDDRFTDPILVKEAADFRRKAAPHVAPIDVRAALGQRYTDFAKLPSSDEASLTQTPPRQVPGRLSVPPVSEKEWNWVNDQLQRAEEVLFREAGGCRKCHLEAGAANEQGLPVYRQTQIREEWFSQNGVRAVFSHKSHKAYDCGDCHKNSGEPVSTSRNTSDVLVPSLASCGKCHSPEGGARANCIECHTYHPPQASVSNKR